MPTIAYYRNSKTGRTYAYSCENVWDEQKGAHVLQRTYLGRVDPTTNEVIPSTGKPGRKRSATKDPDALAAQNNLVEELKLKLSRAEKTIQDLSREIGELRKDQQRTKASLAKVYQTIGAMIQA